MYFTCALIVSGAEYLKVQKTPFPKDKAVDSVCVQGHIMATLDLKLNSIDAFIVGVLIATLLMQHTNNSNRSFVLALLGEPNLKLFSEPVGLGYK